jgi:hypothetical protein
LAESLGIQLTLPDEEPLCQTGRSTP